MMDVKGKNIVVVGLARTGAAVARLLAERGARVTVSDNRDRDAVADYLVTLSGLEITYEFGGHGGDTFANADLIVVSPGVPMNIAPLEQARKGAIPVISEIELAYAWLDAPIAAITGTNGKTTTTSLTGEIFRQCGFRTFVGGNIGNPLIGLVASGEPVDRVVAEISSFQLEGIVNFRPRVAVLLNITEDHLDRYASYQEYIDAKLRIFANQTGDDFAILNIDDPLVANCADTLAARVVPMSRLKPLEQGISYQDGVITFAWEGRVERFPTASFKLRGVHNIDNCMAALATTLLMGCPAASALAAVEGFSGLPHRMEFVATVEGVAYYNDSKGTNVGSVVKSLESFPGRVTLIAGGKDKGGDYAPLAELVRERVSHLILLGEARERIRGALGHLTDTVLVGSLEEAVREAHRLAEPGDVVLFSPACSSFDMFKNYEVRGERFVSAVRQLLEGME